MVVTIAGTNFANPRKDGQAELTWVVDYKYPTGCERDLNYGERSPIPALDLV